MADAFGMIAVIQVVGGLGVYAWTSLALMAVFRKAGAAPWKAWVPVWNAWTLFECAGMRGWWAAVLAGGAVVVGGAAAMVAGALGAAALGASFGGDPADAQASALAAVLVPALLALVILVPALVLHVRMLRGLGRGFGLGAGHTVLGVVLFPVWASIVGWGSARWLPGAAVDAGAPVAGVPGAGVPVEPAPTAPTVPALADFSARPGTAPGFSHTPVFGAPSAASATPGVPAFPAVPPPAFGAPVRPPANPWAPPTGVPAPPTPASAYVAAPSPPPAPAGSPAPSDVEERTVLAGRRLLGWSLVLPDGRSVALTADTVVLGRNPAAPRRAPQAQLVAVDDVTRTVSKTHALLTLTASGWVVTDLDSTNGVSLGAVADAGTEVDGSAPLSGPFFLGDAALELRADG